MTIEFNKLIIVFIMVNIQSYSKNDCWIKINNLSNNVKEEDLAKILELVAPIRKIKISKKDKSIR